jgi:hypothetical protein
MNIPIPSFVAEVQHPAIADLLRIADAITEKARELKSVDPDRMPIRDLLVFFKQLDDSYTQLDDARKRVYHILDELDKVIVPEALEKNGCEDGIRIQFSDTIGYNFRRATKYSAKTLDKEAAFAWVRDMGAGGIITETINASTFASFLKEKMLNEGIEPPEGVAQLTTYYGVGVNKYTPK